MSTRIVITGGAGFVGSSLALRFKRDNPKSQVIAFDNLKRRGSEYHLGRLKKAGVAFVHGDVRCREDWDLLGGCDLLVECAAEPSVLAGYGESPEYLIQTNLMGSVYSFEYARKSKAPIVFLSTSRIYPLSVLRGARLTEAPTRFELADGQTIPGVSSKGISEACPLDSARSIYGTTKLAGELLLLEYLDAYGLKGIINRCGLLTGRGQMGKSDQGVVALWVARHYFKGELSYIGYGGSGKQVRDALHVDDLYDLLKLQLSQLDRYSGAVFNVGGGREVSTSLLELTTLCREATGREISIGKVTEDRAADIPIYLSDCTKISKVSGWKPKTSMSEIVKELATWIQEDEASLRPYLESGRSPSGG